MGRPVGERGARDGGDEIGHQRVVGATRRPERAELDLGTGRRGGVDRRRDVRPGEALDERLDRELELLHRGDRRAAGAEPTPGRPGRGWERRVPGGGRRRARAAAPSGVPGWAGGARRWSAVHGGAQALGPLADLRPGGAERLLHLAQRALEGAPLLLEPVAGRTGPCGVADRRLHRGSDRVDVAFRDGRMDDSQVVAKQIIPMQMIVCASPAYASAHGLPRTVEELDDHRCINFRTASGRVADWEFKVSGVSCKAVPKALHTFNDSDLVLQAVLDGHGVAQLAAYQVSGLLRENRLQACLAQHAPDDRGHYACYLSRKHLPARIRVFIDHMTEQIRALDLHCPTQVVPLSLCR